MDLKRGEWLIAKRWWSRRGTTYPKACYRFRIDPVPYCHNFHKWFGNWYKTPKTTQEKRWSFAYPEYVRGRRSRWNLPDAWDDRQRGDTNNRKCWKNKKIKKQWMKAGIRQR